MNRVGWLVTVAVLALAGVAFAQPDLIIDPWGASRARSEPGTARFRVTQRANAFQGTGELIVDPWRGALASRTTPLERNTATLGPAGWSSAGEIVDPWASSRRRAAPSRLDALIVDPWKR